MSKSLLAFASVISLTMQALEYENTLELVGHRNPSKEWVSISSIG